MIPQIVMGGATAIYSGARLYSSYRYWSDYQRNTGMKIRYPLKTLSRDIAPAFVMGGAFTKSYRKGARTVINRNSYNYYL